MEATEPPLVRVQQGYDPTTELQDFPSHPGLDLLPYSPHVALRELPEKRRTSRPVSGRAPFQDEHHSGTPTFSGCSSMYPTVKSSARRRWKRNPLMGSVAPTWKSDSLSAERVSSRLTRVRDRNRPWRIPKGR